MVLAENEKQEFINAAWNTFAHDQLKNINQEMAEPSILEELNSQLSLNKSNVITKRMAYFNIRDAVESHFKERVYTINQKSILAGIRHFGGDADYPFIHIWPNFDVNCLKDIEVFFPILKEDFSVFSVKKLSLWLNPLSTLGKDLETDGNLSRVYMVGDISKLKQNPIPPKFDLIKLQPVVDGSYRSEYEEIYEIFHKQKPELKQGVPINSANCMQDSINDKLMFKIIMSNITIGYIAGEKSDLLGQKSVYVSEILLKHNFKGQGLAVSSQRKFIEQLPDEFQFIWGTIDHHNTPSLKTSMRVGRIPIRGEYLIEF